MDTIQKYNEVARLSVVWKGMNTRCHDPRSKQFLDYGARGIYVCEEWRSNFGAFAVWALAQGSRKGLEFDRVDNDGPYSPENVRLVSRKMNNRNRRNTQYVTAFGETKSLGEWGEDPRTAVATRTVAHRIQAGWDHEKALTLPTTRGATHCKFGHEYTEENTYHPPSKPHLRECRKCHALRSNERYHNMTKQREKNGLYK